MLKIKMGKKEKTETVTLTESEVRTRLKRVIKHPQSELFINQLIYTTSLSALSNILNGIHITPTFYIGQPILLKNWDISTWNADSDMSEARGYRLTNGLWRCKITEWIPERQYYKYSFKCINKKGVEDIGSGEVYFTSIIPERDLEWIE